MLTVMITVIVFFLGSLFGKYLEQRNICEWLKHLHYDAILPTRYFPLHLIKRIKAGEHYEDLK